MSMGRSPQAVRASKDVGAPIFHWFGRAIVYRGRVTLKARGVREIVGNHRLHRFPFVAVEVGKPGRDFAKGCRDVGSPALALTPYREQSHGVRCRLECNVRLGIAGVKNALSVDELRQEVAVKILDWCHKTILDLRAEVGNRPVPGRARVRPTVRRPLAPATGRRRRGVWGRGCQSRSISTPLPRGKNHACTRLLDDHFRTDVRSEPFRCWVAASRGG